MKDLINIIEKLKVNSKIKLGNDWTIKDAKNGDIILSKYNQFIYKGLDENKDYCTDTTAIIYHASYALSSFHALDKLSIGPDIGVGTISSSERLQYKLSNKEECKELFDALEKEGYKWDEKKLELIKI